MFCLFFYVCLFALPNGEQNVPVKPTGMFQPFRFRKRSADVLRLGKAKAEGEETGGALGGCAAHSSVRGTACPYLRICGLRFGRGSSRVQVAS